MMPTKTKPNGNKPYSFNKTFYEQLLFVYYLQLLDKNNLLSKQSLTEPVQYLTVWHGELAELNALLCANA